MNDQSVPSERRIQQSLLAGPEKKVLIWLAARMPGRLNSDHLTTLGLLAMIMAGVFYGLTLFHSGWLQAVNVAILVNWFGDSLDGTLARFRGHTRPRYGFYVDHVSDSLGAFALVGGLAVSPFMSGRVAFVLLASYLLLSINSYLSTHVLGEFRISFFRMGPTELRILLVVGNLFLLADPSRHLGWLGMGIFDAGGLVAALLMLGVLTCSVCSNVVRLYQLEPLPSREPTEIPLDTPPKARRRELAAVAGTGRE